MADRRFWWPENILIIIFIFEPRMQLFGVRGRWVSGKAREWCLFAQIGRKPTHFIVWKNHKTLVDFLLFACRETFPEYE